MVNTLVLKVKPNNILETSNMPVRQVRDGIKESEVQRWQMAF